ncbi:nucleotidyltransferase domain-containing protein [Chloroflexus sp. Y-396-1]|uniref:nucleotidyltransferase domain-containing protein n=1 Tax=Chloroflexus sp. Y-396-1 TaxID=867845 RepID=UPI0004910528|nr:nucleotidyltransferase domain-containing protein [Chloroflexus sp. Y-396-1]
MPFNAPSPSSSSVVIRSIDRASIEQAVACYAARLRAEHAEIERIIWFGSWVNGIPTPKSAVDLCVIVASTDKAFHERAVDFLPVGFPVGIDLFVYTPEEFERLRKEHPSWYESIQSGREVGNPAEEYGES